MAIEIKNKQLRELAEACAIFDKYVPEGAYVEIHGEHDEIMLGGVSEEAVSSEDTAKLDELGWAFSEDADSFVLYG